MKALSKFVFCWFFLGMVNTSIASDEFDVQCNQQHNRVSKAIHRRLKSELNLFPDGSGGSIWSEGIKRWSISVKTYGRLSEDKAFELYINAWHVCKEIIEKDESLQRYLAAGFLLEEGLSLDVGIAEADGSYVPKGFPHFSALSKGDIVLWTRVGKWEPLEVIARRPYAEVEKQVFGDSSNPSS